MDTNVKRLRDLAAKICPEGTEIHGDTVAEVLACINTHYKPPTIPSAPNVAGEYNLVVDSEGVASWEVTVKIPEYNGEVE